MNAEKWKLRIRHRINQVPNQKLAFGFDFIVFTSERHDANLPFLSRQFADAVAVQAGAVDQKIPFIIAGGCLREPAGGRGVECRRFRAQDHARALCGKLLRQRFADSGVIHDPFLRNMKSSNTPDVRFDLPHLFGLEQRQPLQAVLLSALVQGAQPRRLGLIHGHDQLAADFVRDVVFAAERDHFLDARHRQPRLDRAGLVIQAAVQDPAVMAALVSAYAFLFFQDGDLRTGQTPAQLESCRQTNDAAANNEDASRVQCRIGS